MYHCYEKNLFNFYIDPTHSGRLAAIFDSRYNTLHIVIYIHQVSAAVCILCMCTI